MSTLLYYFFWLALFTVMQHVRSCLRFWRTHYLALSLSPYLSISLSLWVLSLCPLLTLLHATLAATVNKRIAWLNCFFFPNIFYIIWLPRTRRMRGNLAWQLKKKKLRRRRSRWLKFNRLLRTFQLKLMNKYINFN